MGLFEKIYKNRWVVFFEKKRVFLNPGTDQQHLLKTKMGYISLPSILNAIIFNTSIAACLESCKGAERRPTIYLWLVYDILVLHFKRQPLSAGWYVFLYKVRAFRTCL